MPDLSQNNTNAIEQLNSLGVDYLARVRDRGFFSKVFNQHANAETAIQLLDLKAEDINKKPIPPVYIDKLKSLDHDFTLYYCHDYPELNQIKNPSLYPDFLFTLKLLSYLEELCSRAYAGNFLIPQVAHILENNFTLTDIDDDVIGFFCFSGKSSTATDISYMKATFLLREIPVLDSHLNSLEAVINSHASIKEASVSVPDMTMTMKMR